MVIDLRDALYCINKMKEYKTYDNEKIGRIKEDFGGMVSSYSAGRIVIFKKEDDKTLTVEIPYNNEEISKQKEKGSLITTMGTIVGVPKKYIEEILLE
jgi:hypothetical protein